MMDDGLFHAGLKHSGQSVEHLSAAHCTTQLEAKFRSDRYSYGAVYIVIYMVIW